MAEKRVFTKPGPTTEVLDITKETGMVKAKPYVEIEFKFKNESKPMTMKANDMVQAHGKLSQMCEELGLNYRKAFEYHNVIQ